jgi:hypothetical protein
MPAELRTPFSKTPATQAAPGIWRKKVLPVGQIKYQDRVLTFDPEYIKGLADSFNKRAYDQVPFQLADAKNTHTNDPERYRGQILGMDAQPDGLWITVKPTPEGNELLASNPHLGVSARIVEDYARADGQYFPAAIQHVLGTLDPRITGLGPWEAVEMSNQPDMIIDLSAETFAGEEGGSIMPELSASQQAKLAKLLELDPDRLSALVDGLADINAAGAEDLGFDTGYEDTDTDPDDDDIVAAINAMTDAEFSQLASEYDVETGAEVPQYAGAGASLSNDYGLNDIELANYQLAETQRQMAVLQGEHDKQAFENEKRKLIGLGVPPMITELARPLLEGTGHVVELANGQGLDAGLVMRKVLTEFGRMSSMLDLGAEMGSSMDEPDTSRHAEQSRDDIMSRFRSQTGI